MTKNCTSCYNYRNGCSLDVVSTPEECRYYTIQHNPAISYSEWKKQTPLEAFRLNEELNICTRCIHYNTFEGVACSITLEVEGSKTDCSHFEQKEFK